jgi:hypothetical protein
MAEGAEKIVRFRVFAPILGGNGHFVDVELA